MRPKIIVFASGTGGGSSSTTPLGFSKTEYRQENLGGGSGFENLVNHSRGGDLDADIVAVVSNHEHGGVRERADRLGIPFIYFPGPYTAENYRHIVADAMGAEPAPLDGKASLMGWVALSGWLKLVHGLDPARTFNIHPAPLSFNSKFSGNKMYGRNLHKAIADALARGEISASAVSMHFVTEEYDRGPAFFEYPVPLTKGMTAEQIQKAVHIVEHEWQPKITNMVVHGEIRWDGKDPTSLVVPSTTT